MTTFLLALLTVLVAAPLRAEVDNPLYFVRADWTHDNNLFRLASQPKSDDILSLVAGVNARMNFGRQQLLGNISAFQNQYQTNSHLDYTGYDGRLHGLYQIGNAVSGDVGCDQQQTLTSLVDDQDAGATRNLLVTRNCTAGVRVSPSGKWAWGATLGTRSYRYSAADWKYLERDEDSIDTSLGYTSKGENTVVGYLTHTRFQHDNWSVSPRYRQTDLGVRGSYRFTTDAVANFKIGQLSRKNPSQPQRNFSGVSGRLDGRWQATGKTRLDAALYRNVGAVFDLYANDLVVDGLSLGMAWQPTAKMTVTLKALTEKRKYQDSPGPTPTASLRQDEFNSLGLNVDYAFSRKGTLSGSLRHETRSSNQANLGFDADVLQLTLNFAI